MVVNLPPRIKPPLAGRHIRPGLTLDDLDVERPMEALVFALGLRMERSTVADSHAQLEQPDRQSRPFGLRAGRPPGWAVVAEDALRHPKAPEDRREMSLHRLAALVGTGVKPDAIPGMVVEHGQGMATTGGGREVAFEIHLPELVGPIALEADKGTWGGRVRLDAAVTAKDRRDGARGRNVLPIESDEAGMNLSASPCRMLLTQSKHLGLDVIGCSAGRDGWSSALVAEAGVAVGAEASEPLVASLPTDLKAFAELADIGGFALRETDEFGTELHGGHLIPWHDGPPFEAHVTRGEKCYLCLRTRATHVSGLNSGRGSG